MNRPHPPTARRRYRPALELLEGRAVPTALAPRLAGGIVTESVRAVGGTPVVLARADQGDNPALQNGIATEELTALANELHADAWFNTPHTTPDDYARTFPPSVRRTPEPGRVLQVERARVAGVHAAALVGNGAPAAHS